MKDYLICIKEQPGFKPGDLIDITLFYEMMDNVIEIANYEIWHQQKQIKLKAFQLGLDIINDFVGLTIWPYDEDLIWLEFRELDSSFVTEAMWRDMQIDSILMDDFDSLFNN